MNEEWRNIEIAAVDGFQGREKEVVVFAAVRSNGASDAINSIGFLKDGRRFNVALTRARRGLIVVGNPTTLARNQKHWAVWLRWFFSSPFHTTAVVTSHLSPQDLQDYEAWCSSFTATIS
jgi:hypothetical protein